MATDIVHQVDRIAYQLGLSSEEVMQQSITYLLEAKLRELSAETAVIKSRYQVSTPEDFEDLYRKGIVEEESSWRDYQRLETLSYKIDQIRQLLVR